MIESYKASFKDIAIAAGVALALCATFMLADNARADDINITNNNSASLSNTINVSASTGGNTANGARGRSGGDGGSANDSSSDDHTGNTSGGSGGSGGAGGMGGIVSTGDASAAILLSNFLNYNEASTTGDFDDNVNINNQNNSASLSNNLAAAVATGSNNANGSRGGWGGEGASANDSSDDHDGDTSGGSGGSGGDGGEGGAVLTGASAVLVDLVNVLNENITRLMGEF